MKAGARKQAAWGPVPDAKKRKVSRHSPDVGPPGDQQPGKSQGVGTFSNQPAAASEQTGPWEPNSWAQKQLDIDLVKDLKKLYTAARQPSDDGCWTFTGTPMAKDHVQVHYSREVAKAKGRRLKKHGGFFLDEAEINCADQLKDMKQESSPWPVFHFEGVAMHDKETGECFEVKLGDYVILLSEKLTKSAGKRVTVEEELIGRVTEIMFTIQEERLVRVHWMYRSEDTALAAEPKGVQEKDKELWQGRLPVGSFVRHPRLLWVSATEADNERYTNLYSLSAIDRPVKVVHIQPGYNHPDEVPQHLRTWESFDEATDYFYTGSTSTEFITFEDVYEDWRLFSPRYTELWRREGVEGIKRLQARCSSGSLSDLDRGFTGKKLDHGDGKRVLNVVELFAGGGGFSHLAQQSDKCDILSTHANDINESAAATYACNVKSAQVSCCGLEEYTQLHIKWGAAVQQFLGEGWQPVVAPLRSCACKRRYSRQHMPRGVGCCGSIVGQPGTSGDGFEAAARRADNRLTEWRKEKGAEDEAAFNEPGPDWDSYIDGLAEVKPDSNMPDEDHLPGKPHLSNSAADKKLANTYKDARAQQLQRIEECRKLLSERPCGKVLEVRNVRIVDCAPRVTKGSSKKQLQEALEPWKCWLEFEARFESSSSNEWVWVHQALLWRSDAVLPMRQFMLRMIHDKTIPLPGDVHLLTGGPPCQNVSGLNRHAKQELVLEDAKNRLVVAYLRLVRYLKPNYFIMEQVKDIFTKEQGMYARYTLQTMLDLGYQVRAGVCVAGNYGVPQGRLRVLIWGARSGVEQLPPFPASTHGCKPHNIACPKRAQICKVELPTGVSQPDAKLHPMVLGGDILTDLPKADNFFEGDCQQYARNPEFVPQAFLRRPPPAHERSLEERCVWADAAMQPWQKLQQMAPGILAEADQAARSAKILAVGTQTLCKNKGNVSVDCIRAAAAAARNATKGNSKAATACSEDDHEDEEDAAAAALAAAAAGEDEQDAKDAAEVAAEVKASKNFANETWKCHLADYSQEDTDWQILNMLRDAEVHNVAYALGVRRLHLLKEASKQPTDAPLRDHRALLCNADDYLRMCAVPKEKGANFRDMPGVVTHSDKKTCSGSWHAAQYMRNCPKNSDKKEQTARLEANLREWHALSEEKQAAEKDVVGRIFKGIDLVVPCPGGGCPPKPPRGFKHGVNGNDRHYRVDNYGSMANNSWRAIRMGKCSSAAYWGASGDLICPRWCVTYKNGESNGRHGCYGRLWYDDLQQTVVTRAEPHNLQLLHPDQDRVLSIRENARCQGFPDYHVLVGLAHAKGKTGSHGKGSATVDERYLQIGNAVAPPLAAGLGRCLLLAATEDAPVGVAVVAVPDPEYEAVVEDCKQKGIDFWCKMPGNVVDMSDRNSFYWKRHNPAVKEDEEDAGEQSDSVDEDEAAAATPSGGKQRKQTASAQQSGPATGEAAAAAGSSKEAGGSTQVQQKRKASNSAAGPANKRRGSAAGGAGSSKAAAGSDGAAGVVSAKHKPGAAAGASGSSKANGSGSSRPAAAGPGSGRGVASVKSGNSRSAAAASGTGGTAATAVTPGSSRTKRAAAAAATAAIRNELEQERTPLKKLADVAQRQQQQAAAGAAVVLPASPAAAAAAAQLRQQHPVSPAASPAAAATGVAAGEQTEGSFRSSADLLASDEPQAATQAAAAQKQLLAGAANAALQSDTEEGSQSEELISV